MILQRYAKWRDCSFLLRGGWMPEATVDVIEGDRGIHNNVLIGEIGVEMIKRGEIAFSTREAAKEAAREMVAKLIQDNYSIREKILQEW